MSIAATNKLTQMVKEVPDQSAALTNGIGSITDEVNDLTKEKAAITDGVCGNAEADLVDYLENTKKDEVGGAAVVYGPDFGTIDYVTGGITDWTIDSTGGSTIYEYEGVGWDSDTTITQLITDYAFGNDYIERPLTPPGATYGLTANISTLNSGKSILQTNKAKIDASADVFNRYAT